MAKQEAIKQHGEITEALGSDKFRVELENGMTITCTPRGKMRLHHIILIPGDRVEVELSPYDLTKGRITYRKR